MPLTTCTFYAAGLLLVSPSLACGMHLASRVANPVALVFEIPDRSPAWNGDRLSLRQRHH
jgi:hypothetical protein